MTLRRSPMLAAALGLAVAAALPAGAAVAAPSASSARTLTAAVGPGYTITVKKAGRRLTRLPRGVYTLRVSDRSAAHNFKLQGPGVERLTSVRFVGTQTWRVRLSPGVYSYECDPHDDSMQGTFRVT